MLCASPSFWLLFESLFSHFISICNFIHDMKNKEYNIILFTALIWSAKISLNNLAGGYVCCSKFAHSSTQTKSYTCSSRISI